MHPSANFSKQAIEDFQLADGTTIMKDCEILFIPILWSLRECYFVSPLSLIPERWFPENEHMRNNEAYIPFSIGHRNCVGMKLALLEMKSAVILLLREFTFSYVGKTPLATSMDLTNHPDELLMKIKKR